MHAHTTIICTEGLLTDRETAYLYFLQGLGVHVKTFPYNLQILSTAWLKCFYIVFNAEIDKLLCHN